MIHKLELRLTWLGWDSHWKNWTKIDVIEICRLTRQNIRASHLDLECCWRSRVLEVSLRVGYLLCLVTVRRVLASMDFMSSLRSTTRTLLGLSMQPSTKLWSILLVQHLLKWLLMLPSAPWRPWKFASKLSLGLPGVCQMDFPSLSSLKELLGIKLTQKMIKKWHRYVVTMECTHFRSYNLIDVFEFAGCTKGLFLSGDDRFHVSWSISFFSCYLYLLEIYLVFYWFILSISSGLEESFDFLGLYKKYIFLVALTDWLEPFVVIWFKKCFLLFKY